MIKSVFFPLVVCFFYLSLSICSAAATDNSTLFRQGQNAFAKGQHTKALSLFQQAEAGGMHKSSLYYNTGVCAYTLKQYPLAKTAFHKVIALNNEMAPLAHYNLGLVAMRQGHRQEMIQEFETAYTSSRDPRIRNLSAKALKKKGVSPKGTNNSKNYIGFVELSAGYDDNIELYSDLLGSNGDGDWFTEFFAAGTIAVNGGSLHQGTQLFSSLYYQKFADFSEYDLGTADIGIRHLFSLGKWQFKPSVDYAYSIQDGKSYDQTPTVSILARHPFYGGTEIRFSYRFSYIDILDSSYDYLQGTRNKFRTELIRKWLKTSVSFRYTWELNDRDLDFVSPTRHTFAGTIRYRPIENFTTAAIVSFRISDTDVAIVDQDRDEDRLKTTLRTIYHINPDWNLTAEYTYTDNTDNTSLSRYNYTRNVTSLRLERVF